jgi:hypothetical protein
MRNHQRFFGVISALSGLFAIATLGRKGQQRDYTADISHRILATARLLIALGSGIVQNSSRDRAKTRLSERQSGNVGRFSRLLVHRTLVVKRKSSTAANTFFDFFEFSHGLLDSCAWRIRGAALNWRHGSCRRNTHPG